jgi:hypothetical protein
LPGGAQAGASRELEAGNNSPSLLDEEEPPSVPAPDEYDVWVDVSYFDEPKKRTLYLEISSDSEDDEEREWQASQELCVANALQRAHTVAEIDL